MIVKGFGSFITSILGIGIIRFCLHVISNLLFPFILHHSLWTPKIDHGLLIYMIGQESHPDLSLFYIILKKEIDYKV